MVSRALLGLLLLGSASVALARGDAPVTEAEIRSDIAVLASDEFLGRQPATAGETLTLSYIGGALHRSGLRGGMADGGWYQRVPMVRFLDVAQARMSATRNGAPVAIPADAFALRSYPGNFQGTYPVVYIGDGRDGSLEAPAGVAGKVVLMTTPTGASNSDMRQRQAALARAGAIATLTVLPPTANPAQLRSAWTRRAEWTGEWGAMRATGGVTPALATALGAPATAEKLDTARDLGVELTLDVASATYDAPTYNLVAKLPGRRPERGAILLTGHWDHLGAECRPASATDRICNGAVDNASGIAALLAVARRLGSGPRLDHDVYVIATTAEELGLVGARQFVASLPLPKDRIRAVLNVDTIAIAPRGAPMAIVGRGANPWLDAVLDQTARSLGRAVDTDLEANAFIMRQDGAAFVADGIPAVMAGGSFADLAPLQRYLSGPYHGPDDELTDATPLGGAADDADLHVAAVRALNRMR